MHLKVFVKLKKPLKPSRLGKKTQKTQKKPKKPKKNPKNPLGWVFLKKTRVFSNPVYIWSESDGAERRRQEKILGFLQHIPHMGRTVWCYIDCEAQCNFWESCVPFQVGFVGGLY